MASFLGAVIGGVTGALAGRQLWCRWRRAGPPTSTGAKVGGAAGATGGALAGAAAGSLAGPVGMVAGAAVGSATGDKLGRGAAGCLDPETHDPAAKHDLAAGVGSAGGAIIGAAAGTTVAGPLGAAVGARAGAALGDVAAREAAAHREDENS